MLTRLLPDQVSKHWNIIKYGVERSLPPIVSAHPDKMNRILSAALCGRIDVWVSRPKEDKSKLEFIALTKILYDDVSDTKNLLIYCIYSYDGVSRASWDSGLMTVLKEASGRGCSQIVAYTNLPYVVDLTRRLGGEAIYTFLSFDVKRSLNDLTNSVGESR